MIRFVCPRYQASLRVPDQAGGKKGPCPQCGQRLQVPQAIPLPRNRTVLGAPPARHPPRIENLFSCPVCRADVGVSEEELGRMVSCHRCGSSFAAIQATGLAAGLPSSPPRDFPDLSDEAPYYSAPRKHSGLGIASFLIALLIGGLDVILALVIAVNMARSSGHKDVDRLSYQAAGGGLAMYCLNCMSVPLCLVGFGLGLVGLIAQRDRNHVFSWMGLLGNGIVILVVVGLYVIGAMLAG